jgi:hypothetical protein
MGAPMKCDDAQAALSARFDGEAFGPGDPDPHVQKCIDCQRFSREIAAIRQGLRVEAVAPESVPDVAPAVVATIARDAARQPPAGRARRRSVLRGAAAVVAGVVAGATFVGVTHRDPPDLAFADLPTAVVAAQQRIDSLAADVRIVEHGLRPEVPTRTFTGTLRYAAPESMALVLHDTTAYPSSAWVPDDVTFSADGGTWWASGPRACPAEALPACTPKVSTTTVITGREPFSADAPVALDLVTPVASLAAGGEPASIGSRVIDGRPATGVRTTAARVAPLLAGLAPAGNLRTVDAGDIVDLWLDRTALVPVAVTVRAGSGTDRARWAAEHGYDDTPGDVVLDLTLTNVVVNGPVAPSSFPAAPSVATTRRDSGFTQGGPGPATVPVPAELPDGFTASRAGTVHTDGGTPIGVRSWTDGRAWISIRATTGWTGDRLFGDTATAVRPVVLDGPEASGRGYLSDDGTRLAVHAAGLDLVVTGSVSTADLLAVAGQLRVTGLDVPDDWPEAATTSLAAAAAAHPGLLVSSRLSGFDPPAVRVDADTVSLTYFGGGDRSFVLTRAGAAQLLPPNDPDARGVRVRGADGRYLPATGTLEWVEDGHAYRLQSASLSLGELLAIAARLAPA